MTEAEVIEYLLSAPPKTQRRVRTALNKALQPKKEPKISGLVGYKQLIDLCRANIPRFSVPQDHKIEAMRFAKTIQVEQLSEAELVPFVAWLATHQRFCVQPTAANLVNWWRTLLQAYRVSRGKARVEVYV